MLGSFCTRFFSWTKSVVLGWCCGSRRSRATSTPTSVAYVNAEDARNLLLFAYVKMSITKSKIAAIALTVAQEIGWSALHEQQLGWQKPSGSQMHLARSFYPLGPRI